MAEFSITLINKTDGSVEGHIAGCADIKRNKRNRADAPWTFSVENKAEARAEYNADFDEETDGWYDIDWLPCAKSVPVEVKQLPDENPEQKLLWYIREMAHAVVSGKNKTAMRVNYNRLIGMCDAYQNVYGNLQGTHRYGSPVHLTTYKWDKSTREVIKAADVVMKGIN